jgi:hypothetical protein
VQAAARFFQVKKIRGATDKNGFQLIYILQYSATGLASPLTTDKKTVQVLIPNKGR